MPCPKWLGKGGFETHTLRDELVARLRLVQTMNMQEGDARRTQLVLEAGRFWPSDRGGAVAPAPISGWRGMSRVAGAWCRRPATCNSLLRGIPFRQAQRQAPWPGCINGCELAVSSGQESARLRIESEGYIHAIP